MSFVMVKSFSCQTIQKSDETEVKNLLKLAFPVFLQDSFWDWKYLQNPVFDRQLVAVAKEDGFIIGVNHWLARDFKLSSSTHITAVLASDIAVNPNYRMKGIGKSLMQFLRSSGSETRQNAGLIYMFANPKLRKRFHTPVGGYVSAPSKTVLYTKILNWTKVKANAASFNEALKLGKFEKKIGKINVLFKVKNSPPLRLSINAEGVKVSTERIEPRADLVLSGEISTLIKIKEKKNVMRSLITAFLMGKLKVHVRPLKLWSVFRNAWIFKEIFSGKIT